MAVLAGGRGHLLCRHPEGRGQGVPADRHRLPLALRSSKITASGQTSVRFSQVDFSNGSLDAVTCFRSSSWWAHAAIAEATDLGPVIRTRRLHRSLAACTAGHVGSFVAKTRRQGRIRFPAVCAPCGCRSLSEILLVQDSLDVHSLALGSRVSFHLRLTHLQRPHRGGFPLLVP